jgi:hypothetical protein
MSSKENSNDESNMVVKLPNFGDSRSAVNRNLNNLIKIKIDDLDMRKYNKLTVLATKRNIIPKKRSDYDDLLDKSSSIKSKPNKHLGEGGKKYPNSGSRSKFYECQFISCNKIFSDKSSYRKHVLTHGEKQVPNWL